ncbi:uncharacterized protein LOC110630894 isoform X3 [Manihot esculenta]|uniref:uncharacterized protein LOC110630894 isoform X3 n=1 Tax=Manihot esculenta TaxID=3983 RepID=UPI001CC4B71F|nr:uncharacterized protein LOC110630894 isoform X3 [Manihot esculenta]
MDNEIVGDGTLMDGVIKNGVCSSESLNGSCDVWSCKDSDSSSADHLVIMVHGIFGSASDWKFAAEQFVKMLPDKVIVHCSERNMSMLTLDGVDVMGERLALEVLEVIQRKPNLRKISFVAHSVGGLVARYAIGILYRPPQRENVEDSVAETGDKDVKATIGGLEAINFITVATPHLGSRGNKQITMLILLHSLEFYFTPALSCDEFKLICNWKNEKTKPYYAPPYGSGACINVVPFLFGLTAIEKTAVRVIHWILKRTGQHLFLADDDEGKPPLLKRMIQDYCLLCVYSNGVLCIQMWAMTALWAGEHHL